MLRLIKEFESIPIDTNQNTIDEIYKKAKEIAINLNNDISKKDIKDDNVYKNINIHKIAFSISSIDPSKNLFYNYSSDGTPTINPYNKNEMMNTSLNGNDIKNRLYRIPATILKFINLFYEKYKSGCVTNKDVSILKEIVLLLSKSALELLCIDNCNSDSLNESQLNNENLDNYINELKSIIGEIREYYEKSDYSKILTPRKKKFDKMKEYLLGAMKRKYTLRIPLYKIENVSKDVRDVVENKFIKDIQGIIAKYNNFVLLSPNWDEDEDIYIYLTLKEPFGESENKNLRKMDSSDDIVEKYKDNSFNTNSNNKTITEASTKLTKEERNNLKDSDFGLPKLRKYPIHDERHLIQAIRMFHYCKANNKQELANNISKKVKEMKLVGKITVSQKNPFKGYFPDWMIEGYNKTVTESAGFLPKNNNTIQVFINDKLI